MKIKKIISIILLSVLGISVSVFAQYPKITQEVSQQSGELLRKAQEASDAAFAKALPIIEKEANEGRPYMVIPTLKNTSMELTRLKKIDWTKPENNRDTLQGRKSLNLIINI
jgi:hypothetical protein